MGKEVVQGKGKSKFTIRDFKDRPAVIQSFKISGLDEKVNECGGSECGFDSMKKLFSQCDFGLVRLGVMSRMWCWLLLVVIDCRWLLVVGGG
jgi:hypothetical protein